MFAFFQPEEKHWRNFNIDHLFNNYYFSLFFKNIFVYVLPVFLFVLVCTYVQVYMLVFFLLKWDHLRILERKFSLCNFEGLISLFLGFRINIKKYSGILICAFLCVPSFLFWGCSLISCFCSQHSKTCQPLWLWNHCMY